MPETGDGLGRAYRDLPREEPPAHLDAAILAASRRAVASTPEAVPRRGFAARWGAPISVAAVLVLGIAISLRMQLEQPGIETSLPEAAREAPAPKAKVAEPPAQALPAEQPPVPKPRAVAPAPKPALAPTPTPVAPAAAPSVAAPAAPAAAAIAPQAAPQGMAESKQEMAADRMRAAPMSAAPMMKRSATADVAGAGASANAREAAVASPEVELERIAKLRAEGRDEEADRALEEFRKRHADYRIEAPMLERVRRK